MRAPRLSRPTADAGGFHAFGFAMLPPYADIAHEEPSSLFTEKLLVPRAVAQRNGFRVKLYQHQLLHPNLVVGNTS